MLVTERSVRLSRSQPKPPVPSSVAVPPGRPQAAEEASPGSWSQRFTLLAMFVVLGKVADIFPVLSPLGLGKILIGLAVLALIFEGRLWREGLLQDRFMRPFIGIVLIAIATAPFAFWRGNSLDYLLQTYFKEVVFIFLIVLTTHTRADVRRVIWAFVGSVLLLDYGLHKYRALGIDNPAIGRNEIAMFSAIAIGLLLALKTGGLGRLVKLTCIGLLALSILLSGSRGGYLGLGAVLAMFMYFKLGGKVALTSVVVMIVGYVAYVQLPADIRGNVDSIINYEQDYNMRAPEGRIEIWKRGLVMVMKDPLTGVGINNFAAADGMMNGLQGQPWLTAHNSPLQVAAEIGLIGLWLYLVLIGRILSGVRRLRAEATNVWPDIGTALALGMTGYLVSGFFLSQGFSIVFYLLMALTLTSLWIVAPEQTRRKQHVVYRQNP